MNPASPSTCMVLAIGRLNPRLTANRRSIPYFLAAARRFQSTTASQMPQKWHGRSVVDDAQPVGCDEERAGSPNLVAGFPRHPNYAFWNSCLVMIIARWGRAPSWRKFPLAAPPEPQAPQNSSASSSEFFPEKQHSQRWLNRHGVPALAFVTPYRSTNWPAGPIMVD